MRRILNIFFLFLYFSVPGKANHLILTAGTYSYNGNIALGLTVGDSVELTGGTYGACTFKHLNGIKFYALNSEVVITGQWQVQADTACMFFGSIGFNGIQCTETGFIQNQFFPVEFKGLTSGCFLPDQYSPFNKFTNILITGGTTGDMFDFQTNQFTYTGTRNTNVWFEDTVQNIWFRNASAFSVSFRAANINFHDSCIIQNVQVDSANTVSWLRTQGGWFRDTIRNFRITARNPSLANDGIDNGFFYMIDCLGGVKIYNFWRTGPNWGWQGRFFVQCSNDTAAFEIWNWINDGNDTYGCFDVRGSGSDTATIYTGITWHHCNIRAHNITNGNQGNGNVFNTNIIFYGSLAANKGAYFYNLFQYHHTQYSSYPDSLAVADYSGASNHWVAATKYAANPLSPAIIQDTTTTWQPISGSPLIGAGINYPAPQITDINGNPSSSLIGAVNIPPPSSKLNGIPHNRYYRNVFK